MHLCQKVLTVSSNYAPVLPTDNKDLFLQHKAALLLLFLCHLLLFWVRLLINAHAVWSPLRIPAYNAFTNNGVLVSKMKLPYSGLENLPRGTYCPNVIGGCGNKQAENKTRQLYKSHFPANVWEAITGYQRASWPQAEAPSLFFSDRGKGKEKGINKHGEFETPSWGVPTAHRARRKVGDPPPGKDTLFKQTFALRSVSKILF